MPDFEKFSFFRFEKSGYRSGLNFEIIILGNEPPQ